tara:strand:+ start:783 stop:1967 length:1185 start_codon:yes stop_codon:yes gene_type:complete
MAAACLPSLAADSATDTHARFGSLDFATGKALFKKNWVPAPASTSASDGLGPLYNARSCNQCHPDGGRGSREASLVFHINDPVYGQQLQRYAVAGLPREAVLNQTERYAGQNSELSYAEIKITELSYGPMVNNAVSARLAPALFGLGMLEKIADKDLLALADEADSNGDGISGRLNIIVNEQGDSHIGRFGWKASQMSLDDQLGRALGLDLGLGNPRYSSAVGDCTPAQQACLDAPNGNSLHHDDLEVNQLVLDLLLIYVRELPQPAVLHSASDSSPAQAGKNLFQKTGCAACHVPDIAVEDVTIHPYSDLLLHDMGMGLADTLNEGDVAGYEWRTSPLWGLGKNDGELLHDGRASSVHQAILWHGGEAAAARDNYLGLQASERNDLILFLNGL